MVGCKAQVNKKIRQYGDSNYSNRLKKSSIGELVEERVGERGSSREDDTIIASISATGYPLPVTDFAPLRGRVI